MTGPFQQRATPTHTTHDDATDTDLWPQRPSCPHCGAACVAETQRIGEPDQRTYECGHTVEDLIYLRRYVDHALLTGIKQYEQRVFISRTELVDLIGRAPAGPSLSQMDVGVLDTQLVIAIHMIDLAGRPRHKVPPALHPSLPCPTTMEVTTWPSMTR